MTFKITLTEHRNDGTTVPLLFGESSVDLPTLLFAYNLELTVDGGCVDCTRFSHLGDGADDLVRVFAGLTWCCPFEELSPDAELRFRIEQHGDFLLETSPNRDPRPALAEVLSDTRARARSELALLGLLLSDAPIVEACSYAATCGWGLHSTVMPREA